MEQFKVARWGNSLAVRLPSKWVKRLGIKEGESIPADMILGSAAIRARLEAERMANRMTREEAVASMIEARKHFPKHLKPEDWKIDHNSDDARG
jgi:antitoxin MazE